MNSVDIIKEFYTPGSRAYHIILEHGKCVAGKAAAIASRVDHLKPDYNFIKEAAMLHDIGMFMTDAKNISCFGKLPYIAHGYAGRELLEKKGFPEHGLVCERHVGAGITVEDIRTRHLPLPIRNMVPVSIEEQIICVADKFFSKDQPHREKSIEEATATLSRYGKNQVEKFKSWIILFKLAKTNPGKTG